MSIVETCGQSRTLKLFFGFFPWPTDKDSNSKHSRVQQALAKGTKTDVVQAKERLDHTRLGAGRLRLEKPSAERVGGVLRTRARGVFGTRRQVMSSGFQRARRIGLSSDDGK